MEAKMIEKKASPKKVEISSEKEHLGDIRQAIFEGFGEYRKQIAEIRAGHGKNGKKFLLN